MASGTFTTMNKSLPGAYFKFLAVPKPRGTVGDRGIATMPLPLSWGPQGQIIELLSTDLSDGKSLAKVGFTATDMEESKLARLCLSGCYKLLVWRIDKGGVKATAKIGDLTVAAKYAGLVGNRIKIAIVSHDDDYDVVTFYGETERDRQTVATSTDLISNDWVDFVAADGAELTATAGIALSGGTDGTVEASQYTDYFAALKTQSWQVMGIPSNDKTLPPLVTSYINDLRDGAGKYVQAVVYDYVTANSVGIISTKQGYVTELETVSPVEFVAYATGICAGAAVNESNCYHLISGATAIVGDVPDDELVKAVKQGWYMLGKRVDGAIVVIDDVNTFTDYSDTQDEDFSDNFVVRLFDEIATTTRLQFELARIGKTANNASGRDALKAQLIANFETLQSMTPQPAIQNFAAEDIIVRAGNAMGDVVVTGYVQPSGHMKKLYGTFYKGKKV